MTIDEELIEAKIREVAATDGFYPGVTILHNIRTTTVVYMSANGLQELNTTLAELRALGPDYFARYFNVQEAQDYVPKIFALLEQNDLNQSISFFQQVRTGPGAPFAWYLSATRLLLRGTDGRPLLTTTLAHAIEPASHVTHKVQRLLDENNFLRSHHTRFATLTRREREILRGVALGQTAQESAGHLFISPQTAETHRRNLRRKLQAESVFELGQYARAFDLI
ncbi:hypothetical protein BEN49_13750 [Hymenobacter coccineus]|uniref:HTH luxR-type domain-containing protein n=2 Tax=Hymenobacter coccineus TaxID=1908235 RepID=A0A1G1SV49_9BACT|nr:hypothetical protein BEN49_13750 [Hymenobacter coccineus]